MTSRFEHAAWRVWLFVANEAAPVMYIAACGFDHVLACENPTAHRAATLFAILHLFLIKTPYFGIPALYTIDRNATLRDSMLATACITGTTAGQLIGWWGMSNGVSAIVGIWCLAICLAWELCQTIVITQEYTELLRLPEHHIQ
jgi:hypothetical protein